MSQVYIANSTHQHQQFHYRLPEYPTPRRVEIAAGRQMKFSEDFNETQLAVLIDQLERFGAVPQSDLQAITRPRALVYSVDRKPIVENKINEARELDAAARQEVSAQETQNAGLSLLSTAAKHGNPDTIKSTTLEVTQVDDRGDKEKGGVNVEISVSKNAPAGKMQTSKRTAKT